MENSIIIIIILVGIPFLIISFSIGLNSKINFEKLKIDDKWNSVEDLIIKKINLTIEFIDKNNQILSTNPLIGTIKSLELKTKNSYDLDNIIVANDNVNIIIEQINNTFDNEIDKKNQEEYKHYSEEIEILNHSLNYSYTIYNENVEFYNNFIKKFPFSLISKIYGYQEYQKFISNK